MNQYDAFSDDNIEAANKPSKPLWRLIKDGKGERDILEWLQAERGWLLTENLDRFREIERDLAIYKGIQYYSQNIGDRTKDFSNDRSRTVDKIVANHVFDLVQNKVSRLVKYRPGVSILPSNDEFSDKVGAKMVSSLKDFIWYKEKFETDVQVEFVKLVHTTGEAYLATLWDEEAGGDHPEAKRYAKEIKEQGFAILRDSQGRPELDEQGQPIRITQPIKNGDVVYRVWNTLDILLDRKRTFKECDYMFHREWVDVEELKERFPDKDVQLSSAHEESQYDYEKMRSRHIPGKCAVYTFFHRRTPMLPSGLEIKFTGSVMLSMKEFPFSHSELPVKRMTDIDLPGELHGVSFIRLVKGLTGTYNNLINMANRNLALVSHPKWMFPAGSVKKESLGNDITMVEFKGPMAPQLVTSQVTPPELYSYKDQIKQDFQQIAGIFGVSRGEPPPGIKAGVALQFLAEQENERFNELVLKYNEWIRQVAEVTLQVAADKYSEDDQRIIHIIGKNNKWMPQFFDISHLHRYYDIRIQNSSALPQSRAARTQTVIDLAERFPTLLSQEQIADILDLAQSDKFMDIATVSIRAAEAENESLLEGGEEINDPKEYEDHVAHWKVHAKQMRDWSFKNETPVELQKKLEAHVAATEMLIMDKLAEAPGYQAKVDEIVPMGFPLLFKMPPPPPPPAPLPPEGMTPGVGAPIGPMPEMPVNVEPQALTEQMAMEEQMALENPGNVEVSSQI